MVPGCFLLTLQRKQLSFLNSLQHNGMRIEEQDELSKPMVCFFKDMSGIFADRVSLVAVTRNFPEKVQYFTTVTN